MTHLTLHRDYRTASLPSISHEARRLRLHGRSTYPLCNVRSQSVIAPPNAQRIEPEEGGSQPKTKSNEKCEMMFDALDRQFTARTSVMTQEEYDRFSNDIDTSGKAPISVIQLKPPPNPRTAGDGTGLGHHP